MYHSTCIVTNYLKGIKNKEAFVLAPILTISTESAAETLINAHTLMEKMCQGIPKERLALYF